MVEQRCGIKLELKIVLVNPEQLEGSILNQFLSLFCNYLASLTGKNRLIMIMLVAVTTGIDARKFPQRLCD